VAPQTAGGGRASRPTGESAARGGEHGRRGRGWPGSYGQPRRRCVGRPVHDVCLMARVCGGIVIAITPEVVFDYVADQRNGPTDNPQLARAEKLTDGPICVGTRFAAIITSRSRQSDMVIEITEDERPIRLGLARRCLRRSSTRPSPSNRYRSAPDELVLDGHPDRVRTSAGSAGRRAWATPGAADLDRSQASPRGGTGAPMTARPEGTHKLNRAPGDHHHRPPVAAWSPAGSPAGPPPRLDRRSSGARRPR
jgi:hypothetical protein